MIFHHRCLHFFFLIFSFARRSTVHSNTIPPNMQSTSTSFDNRQVTEDTSKNFRVPDASFGNPAKVARPPPRVPSGMSLLILLVFCKEAIFFVNQAKWLNV